MTRPIVTIGPPERPKPRTLEQDIALATCGISLALALAPDDGTRKVIDAYRAAVVDVLTIAHRVREDKP
jgi:hypothetical protein